MEPVDMLRTFPVTYRDAVRIVSNGKPLPDFMRLVISEDFPNLHDGMDNPLLRDLSGYCKLWLGNLGAGHTTLKALQDGLFEAARLDAVFMAANSDKPTWPLLLRHLRGYCEQILPPGDATPAQMARLDLAG